MKEELVDQSVVIRCNEDGLSRIIFWLDTVISLVLLELEQAACMKNDEMPTQLGVAAVAAAACKLKENVSELP
jgi:hypothetical protein